MFIIWGSSIQNLFFLLSFFQNYVTLAYLSSAMIYDDDELLWSEISTLFLRILSTLFKFFSNAISTDLSKLERVQQRQQTFLCFPYHTWHVNKLNFKYFPRSLVHRRKFIKSSRSTFSTWQQFSLFFNFEISQISCKALTHSRRKRTVKAEKT